MKPFYFLFMFLIAFSTSADDKQNLDQSRYIASGILGTIPGFGIGHAIQDRWQEKGWIFTAGELTSLSLMAVGGASCMGGGNHMNGGHHNCSGIRPALAMSGMIGFLGFKVWEIIDVWSYPSKDVQSEISGSTSFQLLPLVTPEAVPGFALFASF